MENPVADEEPPHRTTGSSFPVHAGVRVTLGRRRCKDSMDAFAHATDEVLGTRPSLSSGISAAIAADNHACRIPTLKYIGDARVGNEHLLDDGSTCISASRLQLCATSKAGWYAQLRVA